MTERTRAAEAARARQRQRMLEAELPSIIEEHVGEQIEKLENKLVENFREMGQRVVEQSTEALNSQLGERIQQLEEISAIQTETVGKLRDTSRNTEQKVSGVVNNIERALSEAVPGFKLAPPAHLPPQLNPPSKELAKTQGRAMEDFRVADAYCPKCTSQNVRRASRTGIWEEFLRLFFIAPFRCRACRHKFYRF